MPLLVYGTNAHATSTTTSTARKHTRTTPMHRHTFNTTTLPTWAYSKLTEQAPPSHRQPIQLMQDMMSTPCGLLKDTLVFVS